MQRKKNSKCFCTGLLIVGSLALVGLGCVAPALTADAGVIVDAASSPDAAALACRAREDCDDGLDCTTDQCLPEGLCQSSQVSDCIWPAENSAEAENLSALGDRLDGNAFANDLSGAAWNPETQTLWLCRNAGPSMVWALQQGDDGQFYFLQQDGVRAEWSGFGDAEGLTLANFAEPWTLFVIEEGVNAIVEYDLSIFGQVNERRRWQTGSYMPSDGNHGAEGIAFVPNTVLLAAGAVNDQGQAMQGQLGMNGIMWVAHQNGGGLHAFDLNREDGTFTYQGHFMTALDESAGLELDRDAGLMYIWHGGDHNSLEISRLSSTLVGDQRILDKWVLLPGPPAPALGVDNFEGIAVAPLSACDDGKRSLFLTIDGGQAFSLLHYQAFFCPPWGPVGAR